MLTLALMEMAAASLIVALASRLTAPGEKHGLVALSLFCVVVFVIKGGLALFDSFMQNRWIQALIVDFKKRLMERYTRMDYAHQIMRNSGQSLAILNHDVDFWMRIGLSSTGIMLSEGTVFLIIMMFLLYLQPWITLILLALFSILGFVFIRVLSPMFRRWGKTMHRTAEQGHHQALQILQSYKDILIFGKTGYFISLYQAQSLQRAQVTVKSAMAQVIPRVSIESIFVMFFAGLVVAFSALNYNFNELTTVLSAYLYAGFRLLPGLNRTLIQFSNIRVAEASIDKVVSELNAPAYDSAYSSSPGLTFNHSILLRDVTYRYPGTDRDVLRNVDLEIRKGEYIGIIGETGSGKSTLFHLLLGLLIPSAGQVLIDGQYPASSLEWHHKVGYAAQNFHLIDGSVADNIAFGVSPGERDADLIRAALKDAQLDDFITRLPAGLETEIGEKGVLISGGERQRIALARALYRKPEILMLDEATSALDRETESSIMQAIMALKARGLTIITVTHRVDTLQGTDRVLNIEDGHISSEHSRTGS
jgi:ATP-binding cassette subfamily C protein